MCPSPQVLLTSYRKVNTLVHILPKLLSVCIHRFTFIYRHIWSCLINVTELYAIYLLFSNFFLLLHPSTVPWRFCVSFSVIWTIVKWWRRKHLQASRLTIKMSTLASKLILFRGEHLVLTYLYFRYSANQFYMVS